LRFAINTPNFGVYGDARVLAELAHEAEEAGWDGFFLWDHIGSGPDWPDPFADPWIALTAMALATQRIKLGPLVTPLPRRRPWKVAREAVTLDHLSNGRLILGVGIGTDRVREFSCFGEDGSDRLHGELLDEGLDVLTRLWSGETFSYTGTHYQLTNARFLPTPLQQPRIPIWVAGIWPNKKPFRRASQWDGVCPIANNRELTPQDYRELTAYVGSQRASATPFDILCAGQTTGTDRARDAATVRPFAEAGATWWQEAFDWQHSLEQVRTRIRQGPPVL
jgi:alkanesulfonate monooxygenase SsuD/methylene tetrahydromethanopterin reductase-like flavin-dependent oxidoreductase (luciferase family)